MHSKFEKNRMNTFEIMSNLRCKVRMVGTKTATSFITSYDDFAKRAAIAIHVVLTIPIILTWSYFDVRSLRSLKILILNGHGD